MNLQKLYELDLARREIEGELAAIAPRPCDGAEAGRPPAE
jgi:hypothetical protein